MEQISSKKITKAYLDHITYEVIGAAISVQKAMGQGLLESVYHECMRIELAHRNIAFEDELIIKASYRNIELSTIFRCDLFVEKCLVVELKAVKDLVPEFDAKLINHMNLLKAPKSILINFNSSNIFYEGQKTFVSEYFRNLPDE